MQPSTQTQTHTHTNARVCVCIKYKTSSRFTVAVGSHRRRRRRRRFLPRPLASTFLSLISPIFSIRLRITSLAAPLPIPSAPPTLLFSFIKCFASMKRFCPTARLSVPPLAYLSLSLSRSLPFLPSLSVATPFPNAFSPARFGFLISVLILRFVLFRCDFD